MLDAFGKGASEDIQNAKTELYSQMTFNPATNTSLNADAQGTPPLSPKHGTAFPPHCSQQSAPSAMSMPPHPSSQRRHCHNFRTAHFVTLCETAGIWGALLCSSRAPGE